MLTKTEIIGTWVSDSKEIQNEQIIMEFDDQGNLTYTVVQGNQQKQIILLKYWLEENVLFTDQPSAPRIEKTKIILKKNKMVLEYDGVQSFFSKVDNNK